MDYEEVVPCVGQLALPFDKSDWELIRQDHQQVLEKIYGKGNVTVVVVD